MHKKSYSKEDMNSCYIDVDDTLGKQFHYTIAMRDFNGKEQTFWKQQRANLGSNINLVKMGNIKKIQNREYHVSEESAEERNVERSSSSQT